MVSILIPAYNAGRWLPATLESALGQTWPRKEIIVVDDGSKDGTHAIAQRHASATVRVVTQENQGASAARNRALSLCQGDYIQWLDADDLLALDKIAQQMLQVEAANDPRLLYSSSWAFFMHRHTRSAFIPSSLWCDLSPAEWLLQKMANNLHMMYSNWLVSRELTEAAGLWDTRLSLDDDGEYFCRVIMASKGIRFVPEAKAYYRSLTVNSLSKVDKSSKKLESLFLSMQLHVRCLRSLEDSERSRAACVAYLQNWLPCFYPQRQDLIAQLDRLAKSLGGELGVPRLRPKYAFLAPILGWNAASRAQVLLPQVKWFFAVQWDKAMFHLERRSRA